MVLNMNVALKQSPAEDNLVLGVDVTDANVLY